TARSAGEQGRCPLEDTVCAGLLVAGLRRVNPEATLTAAARAAHRLGIAYGAEPDRLKQDAAWARLLHRRGRAADLEACVRIDVATLVPGLVAGGAVPGGPFLFLGGGAAGAPGGPPSRAAAAPGA